MSKHIKIGNKSVFSALQAEDAKEQAAALRPYIRSVQTAVRSMDYTHFGNTLVSLMEWSGVSEYELSERSHISTKTIQRLRNTAECTSEKRTLVALCIGMQLPPVISRYFLQVAGIILGCTSDEDIAYDLILSGYYRSGIAACNALLTGAGLASLTNS